MMRERGVEFMIFALCGGDARTARLAGMLLEDGHGVRAWALEDAPLPGGARQFASAAECCSGADCVLLPLPAAAARGALNAPFSPGVHCPGELFSALRPGTPVLSGGVSDELRTLAAARAVRLRDYSAPESFRAFNSLATAEGALAVLLRESEDVLCGKRALIFGAGRITRALAPRLAALGLDVTVASRDAARRAWYSALGFGAADTASLGAALGRADIVINTAPALVLTASRLTELEEGALVLDLAGKPGGVDFDAARAFGIHALAAPGLPGRYSPLAAARAVRDAIYAILEEEQIGKG